MDSLLLVSLAFALRESKPHMLPSDRKQTQSHPMRSEPVHRSARFAIRFRIFESGALRTLCNMASRLPARHFGPTSRIGTPRTGAPGHSVHARKSAPSVEVAHVESKHLLWLFTSSSSKSLLQLSCRKEEFKLSGQRRKESSMIVPASLLVASAACQLKM